MPQSLISDLDLLARAGLGDEAAFSALYERHRLAIYRFALRLLGDQSAAEDVTHDCFLGLLKKPCGFDARRANLRTYLYGAARNLAMKRFRRYESEAALDGLTHEPRAVGAASEPLIRILNEELSSVVQRAVGRLPPQQREALVLFEFEEVSLAEIAEIVGADVGAVKARLWRARQQLRLLLAPYTEESAQHQELVASEGNRHAR
ncbi:MAG: RNA polymerase sigma factor [Pyrinomonadaceae bacterium]